jgi:hypothetical protein
MIGEEGVVGLVVVVVDVDVVDVDVVDVVDVVDEPVVAPVARPASRAGDPDGTESTATADDSAAGCSATIGVAEQPAAVRAAARANPAAGRRT